MLRYILPSISMLVTGLMLMRFQHQSLTIPSFISMAIITAVLILLSFDCTAKKYSIPFVVSISILLIVAFLTGYNIMSLISITFFVIIMFRKHQINVIESSAAGSEHLWKKFSIKYDITMGDSALIRTREARRTTNAKTAYRSYPKGNIVGVYPLSILPFVRIRMDGKDSVSFDLGGVASDIALYNETFRMD